MAFRSISAKRYRAPSAPNRPPANAIKVDSEINIASTWAGEKPSVLKIAISPVRSRIDIAMVFAATNMIVNVSTVETLTTSVLIAVMLIAMQTYGMYSTKLIVPFLKQFHPDLVLANLQVALSAGHRVMTQQRLNGSQIHPGFQ